MMAFPVIICISVRDDYAEAVSWFMGSGVEEDKYALTHYTDQAENLVLTGVKQRLIISPKIIRGDENATIEFVEKLKGKNSNLEVLVYTSDTQTPLPKIYKGRVQKQKSHLLQAVRAFLLSQRR
jgi:hypothetical protein